MIKTFALHPQKRAVLVLRFVTTFRLSFLSLIRSILLTFFALGRVVQNLVFVLEGYPLKVLLIWYAFPLIVCFITIEHFLKLEV